MIAAGLQRIFRAAAYVLLLSSLSPLAAQAAARTAVGDPVAAIVMVRLLAAAPLVEAGRPLDKEALRSFYAQRGFTLAWDWNGTGLGPKAAAVYAALASADSEGLEPADYHVGEIARLASASSLPDRIARDLLITDGVLHYASDVSSGRLNASLSDERSGPADGLDSPLYLAAAASLRPADFATALATLPPATPEYTALKARLASLRQMAAAGVSWQALPDGPSLHPGVHDPSVPALRERLMAESRIPRSSRAIKPEDADRYDTVLSGAVATFQAQHGIKPDGVIGKDTRAALDQPLDSRIRQVVANMERARWTDIPITGRMVEVNLAAYQLKVYQDGQPILAMPVVVGTPENQTPIISSRITTVVVNPNWTLPPNVIREILPRIHSDDSYLAGRGIGRFEKEGHVRLIQPPGPANPLGHYKFIMPNDQDIYLHDSPDAAKFHFTLRAYSHGCVRLGNPAALAALLLDDRVATLPVSLEDLAATWKTHNIALSKPVPVSLVYRTAWLDKAGGLVLAEDGYGRDQRLWKALHRQKTATPAKRLAARMSQASVL